MVEFSDTHPTAHDSRSGISITSCVVYAFLALILLVSYWPVFTTNYGYNDDYCFLEQVKDGTFNIHNNVTWTQGRPLLGLSVRLSLSPLRGIDDLKWVRLLSLLGVLIFCAFAYRLHIRTHHSRLFSFTVACLLALTPGFAVFVSAWAIYACNGFAAAAALIAGEWIWDAVGNCRKTRRIAGGSAGLVVLLVVFLTYQPVAPFCLYVFLLRLFNGRDNRIPIRRYLAATLVFVASALVYFALYKLITIFYCHGSGQVARGALTLAPLAKLFFLAQLMRSAILQWSQFAGPGSQATAWIVWILLASACLAGLARRGIQTLAAGAAAIIVSLILSVLPILAVRQNDFEFRTHATLQCLCILIAAVGGAFCVAAARRKVPRLASPLRACMALGVLVFFVAMARHTVVRGIILPNAHELAALRHEVEKLPPGYSKRIVYYMPEPSWNTPDVRGEFGVIASPAWWNTASMLKLLQDERSGRRYPASTWPPLQVYVAQGRNQHLPVVDGFDALYAGRCKDIDDPYWGHIRCLDDGWCMSGWFGTFLNSHFPEVYNPVLGTIECSGKGKQDFWFFSKTLGLLWTSPACYPAVYLEKSHSWAWISQQFLPKLDVIPLPNRPAPNQASQKHRESKKVKLKPAR